MIILLFFFLIFFFLNSRFQQFSRSLSLSRSLSASHLSSLKLHHGPQERLTAQISIWFSLVLLSLQSTLGRGPRDWIRPNFIFEISRPTFVNIYQLLLKVFPPPLSALSWYVKVTRGKRKQTRKKNKKEKKNINKTKEETRKMSWRKWNIRAELEGAELKPYEKPKINLDVSKWLKMSHLYIHIRGPIHFYEGNVTTKENRNRGCPSVCPRIS